MEIWTAVPGYQGWYEISSHGRVRVLQRSTKGSGRYVRRPLPTILAPLIYKKGYIKAHFSTCNGTRPARRAFVHRVMWEAFYGPIPEGLTINHIDGVKGNNRLDNLELASHGEQSRHAHSIGLCHHPRGESMYNAILTEADVRSIRERHAAGTRPCDLAREYGIDQSHIYTIVTRKRWKHVV